MPIPNQPSRPGPTLRGHALTRRARYLETKITEGVDTRPGVGYDIAEYMELLWVFESLRIPFTPADAAGVPGLRREPDSTPPGDRDRQDTTGADDAAAEEQPPKIGDVCRGRVVGHAYEPRPRPSMPFAARPTPMPWLKHRAAGDGETFVPGEPRGRFIP